MKKLLKFSIPILAIAMLFSTTLVHADYAVTVGATFTYDVVESSQTIKSGSDVGGGDGFLFEDHAFAVGQQVVVEVTAETSTSVDYDATVGSVTDSSSSTGFGDALGVAFTLILPLLLPLMFAGWNQTAVDSGPGLFGIFFMDTAMCEFFEDLTNETALNEDFTDSGELDFKQVAANFDNSTTIAIFDWAFDLQITNASTNTDFGGTYRWKLAFDKNTGVVKGTKYSVDYTGTVDGTLLNVVMDQTMEQVGYDMGAYFFGAGGFIPGFGWFIVIPALSLVAGIAVIIRKRK
ncbi:MAG: choice-of-anchor S family protein [Candidatus Heimdallarchaeota archaeon]